MTTRSRAALYWGSAVTAALLLGLAATAAVLSPAGMGGAVASGPWHTNLSIGSAAADPYTRARVAFRGLLALNRQETLYYTATTDSNGERLSGDCSYRLEGRDPAARWWSITAYGADSFLIANDAQRYSISRTTVQREPDASFVLRVGASAREGNWLPVKAGEPFELTARFYNPEPAVHERPDAAALPRILKEACR